MLATEWNSVPYPVAKGNLRFEDDRRRTRVFARTLTTELCYINERFNALFDPAYKQGVRYYTVKHPAFKKFAV